MPESRQLLKRDPPITGASGMLHSKPILEIYAEHGLDYVFLDFEHNGQSIWDSFLLEDIVRVTEHTQLEPIIRVPSGEPQMLAGLIRKVLDSGIRHVVVPRVTNAAEVRTLANATRFECAGETGSRGVSSGRGSRWGHDISEEWIEREDETVNLGVMIENAQAVNNLSEILQVDGLEFILIGAMDLTVDLGTPTNTSSDEFVRAMDTIIDACNDEKVPFGQLGGNLTAGLELVDRGASLLHLGSDVNFLRSQLDQQLADIE